MNILNVANGCTGVDFISTFVVCSANGINNFFPVLVRVEVEDIIHICSIMCQAKPQVVSLSEEQIDKIGDETHYFVEVVSAKVNGAIH